MTTAVLPLSIEELDFEPIRACETTSCQAGNPPATHIGFASCGCNCLMCPTCVTKLRAAIDRCRAIGIGMRCNLCNKIVDRDTIRIEPLP